MAFTLLFHTPNTPSELWIIIAVSVLITLNRMHYIVLVQTVNYHSLTEVIPSRFYGKELSLIAKNIGAKKRLFRAVFVDLNLPQLFMLVVCYGLILFGLVNLNYIPYSGGTFSISDSLLKAFSILKLGNTGTSALSGMLFNTLETTWSIIVFIYLVLFLMLASSLIDEESESKVEHYSETKRPQNDDSSLTRKAEEELPPVDDSSPANIEVAESDRQKTHSDVDKQAEAVVIEDVNQQDMSSEPQQNAPNN